MPFIPAIVAGVAAGAAGAGIKALAGKGGKKPSVEQQALDLSNEKWGMQKQAINETTPFLSSFYGGKDVTKTPFYGALVRTGTESTARAYDQAKSGLRRRSAEAGFGYEQPAYQGAETSLEGERASELARVPDEAMQTAADYGMKATALRTGQAGLLNPDSSLGIAGDLENERLKRRGNLWSNIVTGGLNILPKLFGGDEG